MIVQVDRVASVEEATVFRDAGAGLIGVALDPDPRFEDDRFVSADAAVAIQAAIAPARLVGLVTGRSPGAGAAQERARIERVLALRPDFVQFERGGVPDELVSPVRATGVPVIEDGADLDSDHGAFIDPADPAAFVRKQVGDLGRLGASLCHLDVIADREDPWLFLTGEALEWPDEAPQVSDVVAATRELPLLLSLMGLGIETIAPYVRAFPDARGFFARLGPRRRGGPSATAPTSLLAALHALRALRGGGKGERVGVASAPPFGR